MWKFDENGWIVSPDINWVVSPNFNKRPSETVDLIVIHGIGIPKGTFHTPHILNLFTNQLDCTLHPEFADLEGLKVSAHFLITRAGEIIQFVSVFDRAWHAGESSFEGRPDCNDYAIGIELEGADDIPYTPVQYEKANELCVWLMMQFPEITPKRVVRHSDIAPERKTDPGPAFSWEEFLANMHKVYAGL